MKRLLSAVLTGLFWGAAAGAAGMCLGCLVGLALTAFNNIVLERSGAAAHGTYAWWAWFMAALFGIFAVPVGGVIGIVRRLARVPSGADAASERGEDSTRGTPSRVVAPEDRGKD